MLKIKPLYYALYYALTWPIASTFRAHCEVSRMTSDMLSLSVYFLRNVYCMHLVTASWSKQPHCKSASIISVLEEWSSVWECRVNSMSLVPTTTTYNLFFFSLPSQLNFAGEHQKENRRYINAVDAGSAGEDPTLLLPHLPLLQAGDWWLSPTPLSTRYVKSGRQRWDRMLLMSLWLHRSWLRLRWGGQSQRAAAPWAGSIMSFESCTRGANCGFCSRCSVGLTACLQQNPCSWNSFCSGSLAACMAYSAPPRKSDPCCVTGQVSVALLTERYGIQRSHWTPILSYCDMRDILIPKLKFKTEVWLLKLYLKGIKMDVQIDDVYNSRSPAAAVVVLNYVIALFL